MKCVVIAAGYGSRLAAVSPSKPLTPIAGKPLIAHVIERAAAGGASGFVVVTGHRAEAVEDFLASHAAASGLDIATVRTPDVALPNGHSVLAGAALVEGDYLLTMADHVVSPGVHRRLLAAPAADLLLAVDRDLANPDVDLDDVTRVATDDSLIVRIGKLLGDYDAFDTGVFRATSALAGALREAIARGAAGSLSDGVQTLADAGRAMTVDVIGERWIDIDDPASLAAAEAWLGNMPIP